MASMENALDASRTPRRRADLAYVRVANNVVVYEPVTRRLHTLNPSAALVWRCLDGATTSREVTDRLAQLFTA